MTAPFGTEEYAANLALGHLGKPEIAQMSEQTKRARTIRQFFPIARDAMLRLKPWNFATAWHQPAADTVAGTGTFKIRYPMPADCVRVRSIENADNDTWDIESAVASVGGVPVETIILVTNLTAPNVCYTRRVTAVRLWDPLFVDAFALDLAGRMANKLGRSTASGERLRAEAHQKAETASSVNSKEQSHQNRRPETSWSMARRGLRSGYPDRLR